MDRRKSLVESQRILLGIYGYLDDVAKALFDVHAPDKAYGPNFLVHPALTVERKPQ